jgi:long-chain acyl-CoA synthetase
VPCPFFTFAAFRDRGAERFATRGLAPVDVAALRDPEDVVTLIYTSGTTGKPKGVMLTHSNIVSNVAGALARFSISREDSILSFLPLSHVFERVAGYYTMYVAGASISYARGHESVAEDSKELRPTILLGVPRFFEKFHGRVEQAIASAPPLRRRLFEWALRVGLARADAELSGRSAGLATTLASPLAQALVFRKLHARIGGRVRFFVSGGAPLRAELVRFFYAIGIPVYEGYGLTETSPVITVNYPGKVRLGSVGTALPNVQVRIAADGEVEARGPNTTRGYFRNAAATDELYGQDGWLRTGDIGRLDEDGYLFITDRKKELIVTAGGKKVAPLPIENRLSRSRYVTDALLIGDRRKFIGVVFLPEFKALREVAASKGLGPMEDAALVAHPEIRALFEALVAEANTDLARFETIKRFVILPVEATVDNGLLTPSMKLRRRVIEERFKSEIDALFGE